MQQLPQGRALCSGQRSRLLMSMEPFQSKSCGLARDCTAAKAASPCFPALLCSMPCAVLVPLCRAPATGPPDPTPRACTAVPRYAGLSVSCTRYLTAAMPDYIPCCNIPNRFGYAAAYRNVAVPLSKAAPLLS